MHVEVWAVIETDHVSNWSSCPSLITQGILYIVAPREHTISGFNTKSYHPSLPRRIMATSSPTRYKFIFFTPPQYLQDIKIAVFATGAGTYPNYSECCFTTPGIGQFRPGDNANPAIGSKGQLEEVGEVRCEMVCNGAEIVRAAVEALKK